MLCRHRHLGKTTIELGDCSSLCLKVYTSYKAFEEIIQTLSPRELCHKFWYLVHYATLTYTMAYRHILLEYLGILQYGYKLVIFLFCLQLVT